MSERRAKARRVADNRRDGHHSACPPLARFRAELYQSVLGLRRDALCELLDAVLTGDGRPAWCATAWPGLSPRLGRQPATP